MSILLKAFAHLQRNLTGLLIAVFFLHGIVYYFFPADLLNPESSLKWIKYIVILLLALVNFNRISPVKLLTLFFLGFGMFLLMMLSNRYVQSNPTLLMNKFIPYFFPLTVLLFTKIFRAVNWTFLIRLIFFVTSVAAYVEFYVLRGIFKEFDLGTNGGLRISTIFINPNNAGLLMGLLNFFVIRSVKLKNLGSYLFVSCIFINSTIVILLTGSKTGLVVLALHALYILVNFSKAIISKNAVPKKKLVFIVCFVLIAGIGLTYKLFNSSTKDAGETRELSLETGEIRAQQIVDFFDDVQNNFLFPFYNKEAFTLDNTFVQFWGDASLIGFLLLMAGIIYAVYRLYFYRSEILFPFVIIIASGFSINFLYVWPSAYLFWAFFFIAVEMKKSERSLD